MVGKYTVLKDAYKSLIEALIHGGVANNVQVNIDWVEGETFEGDGRRCGGPAARASTASWCPAASASAGPEGKIHAVQFARERNVPYFGICFGMQMAVIEAARNLAGIKDASSTEFGPTAGADRRPDDRVGAGQRAETRARGRRPRRHHAAGRL